MKNIINKINTTATTLYVKAKSALDNVKAEGNVQAVYATFPEFKFSKSINAFRSLENYNNIWRFEKNSYADNNARLHFTPLWYPNGGYTVSVIASEIWTPAGMIEYTINSNSITIVDAAYDDWYVGRG